LKQGIKLLIDPYFWVLIACLLLEFIFIYFIESNILNLMSSDLEKAGTHLIMIIVRSGLFMIIVGITAWRYGFKGGLIISAIIGLILAPHIIEGLSEPIGYSYIAVYFIGAASGIALSLLVDFRKQAENKLEKQVKMRTAELDRELENRIDYTRALVHELKTPLTAIISSSELLKNHILDSSPMSKLANNIFRSAITLNKRIDELLDVAKSEIGILKISYGLFDPNKLLEEVADDMSMAASKRGQTLIFEPPKRMQYIWADRKRVEQILHNLLTNAIKFNRDNGKIILRAKVEKGLFAVEVSDEGKGISKEGLSRLFVPYYRLESDRERLSGLGLGLSLCKKLIELHEGEISVTSVVNKGSIFSFSIPIRSSPQSKE